MSIKLVFLIILIFCLITFFSHYLIVKKAVYGDGIYYYSWVRSSIIDRDLDFRNELTYFREPIIITNNGKTSNKFSIGSSLLWTPFFLFAHIISVFFLRPDGYSHIYQLGVGIGSIFYGWLGIIFCYKALRKFWSKEISISSCLIILLGTNLFFYNAVDVVNSHAVSFFASSWIFYMLTKDNKKTFSYILLGLLTSILAMCRFQDIIFVLPLFIKKIGKRILSNRKFILLLAMIIGFIPQLFIWKYLYGSFTNPYLLNGRFDWLRPQIFGVLFSKDNGLLFYSPGLIFSFIGFYKLIKQRNIFGWWGLMLFVLQLYIVASWYVWWGGVSYGQRMFISLMPYFILGLGAFINSLTSQRKKMFYIFSTILIVINFCSILNVLISN